MKKSELRKIFFERRMALSAAERAEKSSLISELFFTAVDLAGLKTVHSFIPMVDRGEVDTSLIIHELWAKRPEVQIVVPRIDPETGELESFAYTAETELRENRWGVREPAGGEPADPQDIDLVIVPLLCFDGRGYRVGYGKGYYDRFLSRCRPDCINAGVSFFPPIEQIDDLHAGDLPVDLTITPDLVYRSGAGRNA